MPSSSVTAVARAALKSLAKACERFAGSFDVAFGLTLGDAEYIVGGKSVVVARKSAVHTLHGTYAHRLFGYAACFNGIGQTPEVASGAVVACQKHAVDHGSASEAGAECHAHKIAVALARPAFGKTTVYVGKGSGMGFAIGE